MAGLQPNSDTSRAQPAASTCAGSSASAAACGAPCWSGSAGGSSSSTVAASRGARGGPARPAAARWTELHLVSQHAPHAPHPPHPLPPLSKVDQVKADIDPQQHQRQDRPGQQDFEFPQRTPSTAAAAAHPQPLQHGRRSFDTAAHNAQHQSLRTRAGSTSTSGAYPAAGAGAAAISAFPDHAAALGACHSFAHGTGRREGAGDREWGQGHSQRLRGGTSCQLPEAVAALLRPLLHLEAPGGGSAATAAIDATAAAVGGSGGGFAAPDAGRGLTHGAAAASTGNCSCGSDTACAAEAASSRASSAMAGACSGVLGSCASIGMGVSSVSSGVVHYAEALCSRADSGGSSGGGGASTDAAAAPGRTAPEGAPNTAQACAQAPAEAPAARARASAPPAVVVPSVQAPVAAAADLLAVATCPISHTYRLFGRAGDPVLHLRLPGVAPSVLAAAAALSAESRRWTAARLPPGAEAAAFAAAPGFAQQQRPALQRRRKPTLLVATTLADGCEEEGVGGAAGVDVAVMNFTAATLSTEAAEEPAAMMAAAPVVTPPPLTLTLARPPPAAFPLKATEEAGPGPDGGVDVTAFHVYASEDGQQVLLLLVVERSLLMPMLVSPRRMEPPGSVALPLRSGASASSSSSVAAAAAAVAGATTRPWREERLRRQVLPSALLPASDAVTIPSSGSGSVTSLGAVGAPGGASGARQPLSLPLPLPLPLPRAGDAESVPSCCRRLLNSSSFTVWAEHAAQSVPAAAAAVAVAVGGQSPVVGAAAWAPGLTAVAVTAAAARGDEEAVAGPPAEPAVGATRGLSPDQVAWKSNSEAPSCKLHSVASDLLQLQPEPAAQPVPAPHCEAHLLMTVTAPKRLMGTSATGHMAMKPEQQQAQKQQPAGSAEPAGASPGSVTAGRSADCYGAIVWPGAGAAAGAAASARQAAPHKGSAGAGAGGAVAEAVAVIPWSAFVSGDGSPGAASYPLGMPPSPFSPRHSRSSSSSSSGYSSASSATASPPAAAPAASPFARASSMTAPPASAARLRRHRRGSRSRRRELEPAAGAAAGGAGEGRAVQMREMRTLYPAFFPPSGSPSAMPSGAFTSEELFLLSMPSHASGMLAGFSGQADSGSAGALAARFTALADAADAVAAAAAETTTGWLLAGQPVSFPYAASSSGSSVSSKSSSSTSSSSSLSSSLSASSGASAKGEGEPACAGAQPAAGHHGGAAAEAEAKGAGAVPPQLRQPANGEGARRAGVFARQGSSTERVEGAWEIPGAGVSRLPVACGSHPGGGLRLSGSSDPPVAGVRLGRASIDSAGVAASATSASGRAAVSAADAARVARVRAGWRAREAEWSEREAAWRVTESRWWQQAGGVGLWG
ncbi:hypothetical protein HXX76_009690 [Chlamydomonas incerta]|uniref:Uncharacterized protein n=1 Tax=Chlamydomonas incerta TaxID=51695 RepID=A0A835T2A8_CHLIN|nr:hypothetical protein HXX76_009690 [Chlamydomonas incerta]|eukprot:KAG2431160.1 hypothetical protein HXX76_009690 [Chlamydomonas incerta]